MDQRLLGLEAAPPRFQSREAMRNGRSRRVALSFLLLLQTSLSLAFSICPRSWQPPSLRSSSIYDSPLLDLSSHLQVLPTTPSVGRAC